MIKVYASFQRVGMTPRELANAYNKALDIIYEYADDNIATYPQLVYGSYKGNIERSYCFSVEDMDRVVKIAQVFNTELNQECVLAVYHGSCFLIYPDNTSEYIGEWTEVSREFAEKQDAYTFYPLTCEYYVAM